MDSFSDRVELSLPFKAEYVSVARLTASGLASRMGFDIDTVEDIKVAVAEVCNKIVLAGCGSSHGYKIIFSLSGTKLAVEFESREKFSGGIFGGEDDEIGISIINAFMDDVEFYSEGSCILSMSKTVGGDLTI